MATWDGSYEGGPHEDPYYTTYPQQSNQSFVYNNNNPSTSGNSHQYSQSNSSGNCYFENNRQKRNYNNDQSRNFTSHSKPASNLHPGANEFVPSTTPIDPSRVFFADNKNRSLNNRKYDNKRNSNYQRQDDYNRNLSYRNIDKNRRGHQQSNNINTNSARDYDNQVYTSTSNNYEDENNIENSQFKETPGRGSYNKFRGRGRGRYQNDRYLASSSQQQQQQQVNKTNEQSVVNNYQNNTIKTNNDPVEVEKTQKPRAKTTKDYSDDPRDERYRKNLQNNKEQIDDERQSIKHDNNSKNRLRKIKKNDESSYRGRRDYYDDKSGTSNNQLPYKRNNYNQDYNNSHRNYLDRNNRDDDRQHHQHKDNNFIDDKQNWRGNKQLSKKIIIKKFDYDDDASQKERLTEQLNKGQLECLVCCDYIRQKDSTWSCLNCYHVLHLECITKWALSSKSEENGWRCPACQNSNIDIPDDYYCFCGKIRDPEWNRHDTAHSCGEICGRVRPKNNCCHKCTLLCHPGSCEICVAMVSRTCGCGKMTQSLKCCTDTHLSCNDKCDKLLNCGNHKCEKICHHGKCEPCDKKIKQICYCGKETKDIICHIDKNDNYTCDNICNKQLNCNNHFCMNKCHPGDCDECPFEVDKIKNCYCGKTPLTIKRNNCLDSIPTCDKICSKILKCGQPSSPHTCKSVCHSNNCPQCELTTWVKCRCGNMDREIPCIDLTTKADDARCEKKCTKKRSCGKHKCNQHCCIDIEHICPLPCSKTLSCGRHKCELTCHKGRCQPCYRSSFEELYCECGTAVIYPPVPCGTRKPTCTKPCTREHTCDHDVFHNCHSDPTCPPCTVLTQKYCYGKHELRKAVPCYVKELSCGLSCNKPISCGRHKCITLCHAGPCEKPGQVCVQPCTISRDMCGHPCAAPCHDDKCPDTPCKEMVKVTCTCGHRSMTRVCAENSKDFQRIASGILASKMADMQLGHSVDLEEVFGQGAKKQNQLKTLECNDECKLVERNRKLALGLQIVNPDLSGKLQPRYTDNMKSWAKKDPSFCQMVHDQLTELVQLAKTSKQKSRSYSFNNMNREKRMFVHEACEHFGCESQAYDQEPKRNVVATAVKDKCWLPSYSLLEMVQRDNGQRKVPRPMLNIRSTATPTTSR